MTCRNSPRASRQRSRPAAVRQLPVAPVATASKQIIALDLPSEMTGAVVYWTLSGDLDVGALAQVWGELDVAWLPKEPSVETAFTRAMHSFADKHVLVRKHPAGGYVIVDESPLNGKLVWQERGHFWVDGGELVYDANDADADAVSTMFEAAKSAIAASDVGGWLVKLVDKLGGVRLRDTGGIYFLPRQSVATFRAVKNALASCTSHAVFEIPAMRSGEAIGAVLEAVRREALDEITTLQNEVQANEIGKRAVAGRQKYIIQLKAKVQSYEQLLGVTMGDIVTKLTTAVATHNSTRSRRALLN